MPFRLQQALSVWRPLAACLGAVLLLVAATPAVLLQTTWGRRQLASGLGWVISQQIPGRVTLGSIERIAGQEVHVRDLVFHAPNGDQVLVLPQVRALLALDNLLKRELRIVEAHTHGGELRIEEQPDGSLPIEDTFSAPGAAKQTDTATNSDQNHDQPAARDHLKLHLKNLRVANLALSLQVGDLSPIRIQVDKGIAEVLVSRAGVAQIGFKHVQGQVVRDPLDLAPIALRGLRGRYHGERNLRLHIHGPLKLANDKMKLVLRLSERKKTTVKVDLYDADQSSFKLNLMDLATDVLGGNVTLNLHR